MTKVQITDEARDFILKQTEIITVQMELCGGWSGVKYEPAVYAGQPPAAEGYDTFIENGITVYIPKTAVTAPEGVSIFMTGEGPWRGIKIQGLLH